MFIRNRVLSPTAFLIALAVRSSRFLVATIAAAVIFSTPLAASLTSSGVNSQNTVTFAQFLDIGGTNSFVMTNNGTSDTFTGSTQILFGYENISGYLLPALQGYETATLTISATTTTTGSINNGNVQESGFSGSFSIIASTPVMGMSNLLSGTFQSLATFTGGNGANSATFSDSTPNSTEVIFTSSFISFVNPQTEAFGLSFSSVNPDFQLAVNNFIANFTAAGTGTFSSNPPPISDIPEPSSIFSMGLGLFALAVCAIARR